MDWSFVPPVIFVTFQEGIEALPVGAIGHCSKRINHGEGEMVI
jgi:hypothetical protein